LENPKTNSPRGRGDKGGGKGGTRRQRRKKKFPPATQTIFNFPAKKGKRSPDRHMKKLPILHPGKKKERSLLAGGAKEEEKGKSPKKKTLVSPILGEKKAYSNDLIEGGGKGKKEGNPLTRPGPPLKKEGVFGPQMGGGEGKEKGHACLVM